MLLEVLDQVIRIFFANIFDAEVVNDEGRGDVMRHMIPEGMGAGDRRISKLGKVDFQPALGNVAGLFETRHAFSDIHVDTAIGSDEAAQVVLLDDIVREEIQGEFHVPVSGHGGAVI